MMRENIKKKYGVILLALSTLGLIDALYLSYARYAHVDVPCSITNGGCSVVAASPYAVMFGMPLAYLGVLFYVAVVVLSLLLAMKVNIKNLPRYMLGLTLFGTIDSLYFLYLQGFVIKAFCIYCLVSAAITFCLLGIAYLLHKKLSLEDAVTRDLE